MAGAVACLWGCGNGSAANVSPVQWLGLDTRSLAVGSLIPVNLQFTTDGGEVDYTAASSNPSVVSVIDDGGQQLLLSVNAPGDATLSVASNFGSASRPVIAAAPASVTFALSSRLKAGFDTALPTAFALVSTGSEVIQALVYDADGNALSSWGLTFARSSGVNVTPIQPEQFDLTAMDTSSSSTLVAGLAAGDAGSTVFNVSIVNAASPSAVLLANDAGTAVIAEALSATQPQVPVFGLGDWQFTCQPANQCTTDQLSLSAAQVTLPAGAAAGSFTVTATVAVSPDSIQTVTALAKLP